MSRADREDLTRLIRSFLACEPREVSPAYLVWSLKTCHGAAAVSDGPGGAQSMYFDEGVSALTSALLVRLYQNELNQPNSTFISPGTIFTHLGWAHEEGSIPPPPSCRITLFHPTAFQLQCRTPQVNCCGRRSHRGPLRFHILYSDTFSFRRDLHPSSRSIRTSLTCRAQ